MIDIEKLNNAIKMQTELRINEIIIRSEKGEKVTDAEFEMLKSFKSNLSD